MIVVTYGTKITENTYDTLCASDIGSYLKENMSVAIKPNLVTPRPADDGATTHPELVEGIILFLRDFGIKSIKIIESSWYGDKTKEAFQVCGYNELSKKMDVPLIDLKSDSWEKRSYLGTDINICMEALNTDFLINAPVLKAHSQTRLTCCMKNLKGCIPDSEKRRFHTLDLHMQIAILNKLLPTGYCVVDGICGDLSSEEGGQPVAANRIVAGRDPLTIDSYGAELIGYKPDDIKYLTYAKDMGLGDYYSTLTTLIELGGEAKPVFDAVGKHTADRFKGFIDEKSACSPCYAALVFALHKIGKYTFNEKLHIGQGYKGINSIGIGIGNCAKGYSCNVAGCPPKATDIIELLENLTI
ncbi:MAG: DUF362 domain-containing protein [Oscillospiraceae bacterium]|nr:DUF362 domain-containing protein [Oscillospiraceae bacterium]